MNDLVTVVLPTYNRARILRYAIESVLAQTHSNLELIVVDDHSSDDTRSIVESFDEPRIAYVRNAANVKLPSSLNVGFERSRGKYLTWTSDDNLYERDALRQMIDFLECERGDFVFADYYDFADLDLATGLPVNPRHEKLPDTLAVENGNRIGACFLYTRRVYDAVGPYDPELLLVEDYDYFLRISRRFRLHHLPQPLYYFRKHDDSLYVSRFCEVKAADVLIRYRNGILDETGALAVVVALVIRNIERLRNPSLRWVYRALKETSWRLTTSYTTWLERYLTSHLKHDLLRILRAFAAKEIAYKDAKVALERLLQQTATIQYS